MVCVQPCLPYLIIMKSGSALHLQVSTITLVSIPSGHLKESATPCRYCFHSARFWKVLCDSQSSHFGLSAYYTLVRRRHLTILSHLREPYLDSRKMSANLAEQGLLTDVVIEAEECTAEFWNSMSSCYQCDLSHNAHLCHLS